MTLPCDTEQSAMDINKAVNEMFKEQHEIAARKVKLMRELFGREACYDIEDCLVLESLRSFLEATITEIDVHETPDKVAMDIAALSHVIGMYSTGVDHKEYMRNVKDTIWSKLIKEGTYAGTY